MRSLLPLTLVLTVLGCVSQLFEEPPATPEHYFKQAQARLMVRDYPGALALHQLLVINYPDDYALRARAVFANAQIYLTQEPPQQEKAAELYRAVLAMGVEPEGFSVPPAMILLAQRHLDQMAAPKEPPPPQG